MTPPNKITGAFLVGTILPQVEGEGIKVGLVAKKDETRLSDEPERYVTTWGLALAKDGLPASLAKSTDAAYDRILVFEGSEEELKAQFDSITIQLGVVEGGDGTLNSLFTQTLSDLFAL